MNENKIPIPGRLKNVAVGGHVAGTEDIYDDGLEKSQSEVNSEVSRALDNKYDKNQVYTKSETYSKTQLDSMIITPEQKYVTATATVETTSLSDLLPSEGEADTIYRVGCWDGTQYDAGRYTEYAWDGTEYVPLSVKSVGVDTEPTAGSENIVESGGVAGATYLEIPFIKVGVLLNDGSRSTSILTHQVTDFIRVSEGDRFALHCYSGDPDTYATVCGYSADDEEHFVNVVLPGFDDATRSENFVVPSGMKYIRVSGKTDDGRYLGKVCADVLREFSEDKVVIEKTESAYLGQDGELRSTEVYMFSVSDYWLAKAGVRILNARPAETSELLMVCFYDVEKNFISNGNIYAEDGYLRSLELSEDNIPGGAVFFRAILDTETGSIQSRSYSFVPYVRDDKFNEYDTIIKLQENKIFNILGIATHTDGDAALSANFTSTGYVDISNLAEGSEIVFSYYETTAIQCFDSSLTYLGNYDLTGVGLSAYCSILYDPSKVPDNTAYIRCCIQTIYLGKGKIGNLLSNFATVFDGDRGLIDCAETYNFIKAGILGMHIPVLGYDQYDDITIQNLSSLHVYDDATHPSHTGNEALVLFKRNGETKAVLKRFYFRDAERDGHVLAWDEDGYSLKIDFAKLMYTPVYYNASSWHDIKLTKAAMYVPAALGQSVWAGRKCANLSSSTFSYDWTRIATEALGMDYTLFGVGGASHRPPVGCRYNLDYQTAVTSPVGKDKAILNQVAKLCVDHVNNGYTPDLIISCCVLNDCYNGDLSRIGTLEEALAANLPVLDTSSENGIATTFGNYFIGLDSNPVSSMVNMRLNIETLLKVFPKCRIVIFSCQQTTSPAFNASAVAHFNKEQKKLANYYAIPYVDIHTESGINQLTASTFLSDGIHPNTAGGVVYNKFLQSALSYRVSPMN